MSQRTQEQKKVVVLEVNEVPLTVFEYYADQKPNSGIARCLRSSVVMETNADDVNEDELYPSQTWASLNTGARYADHKIHWYNDPKPDAHPLYWRTIAEHGRSVGILGSLHSSPAGNHADLESIKFLIPDCFAEDGQTKPARFEPFQAINLKQTNANRRVASMRSVGADEINLLSKLPALGVRLKTLIDIGTLVGKIAMKRANRERLRVVQFLLTKDIFVKLLKKHDVDLAVMFTNHVASNLHRYWFALFPGHYEKKLYGDAWIEEYRGEIMFALDALDDFVVELMRYCDDTNRIFVLNTSMGQCANLRLKEVKHHQVVVDSLDTLLACLDIGRDGYEILSAMSPEYTVRLTDKQTALDAQAKLKGYSTTDFFVAPDVNEEVLTIGLNPNPDLDRYQVGDRTLTIAELGLKKIPIKDAHTGRHHPLGTLIIYGSGKAGKIDRPVSYREFTPAMLRHFQVEFNGLEAPSFAIASTDQASSTTAV